MGGALLGIFIWVCTFIVAPIVIVILSKKAFHNGIVKESVNNRQKYLQNEMIQTEIQTNFDWAVRMIERLDRGVNRATISEKIRIGPIMPDKLGGVYRGNGSPLHRLSNRERMVISEVVSDEVMKRLQRYVKEHPFAEDKNVQITKYKDPPDSDEMYAIPRYGVQYTARNGVYDRY